MSQPLRKPEPPTYPHVEVHDDDVPYVAGTTMKVLELVEAQIAYGWSPAELHFQHPYLTLGQIHGALSYYWDHQDEIDADIERRLKLSDVYRKKAGAAGVTIEIPIESSWRPEELDRALEVVPMSGAEIVSAGLTGGWSDSEISSGQKWVEERRRQRREERRLR